MKTNTVAISGKQIACIIDPMAIKPKPPNATAEINHSHK